MLSLENAVKWVSILYFRSCTPSSDTPMITNILSAVTIQVTMSQLCHVH